MRKRRQTKKQKRKQAPYPDTYNELKKVVSKHDTDGLEAHKRMYPQIFDTPTYMKIYQFADTQMIQEGYDIVQRSYIHMNVRMDMIDRIIHHRSKKL